MEIKSNPEYTLSIDWWEYVKGLIKKLWTIIVLIAIFGAIAFFTRPEFLEDLKTNISSGVEDVIDPLKDSQQPHV